MMVVAKQSTKQEAKDGQYLSGGRGDRILTPVVTLRLFLLQILHGNIACRALTHLSERSFTAASYCDGRERLPIDVLGLLCAELVDVARQRLGWPPATSLPAR